MVTRIQRLLSDYDKGYISQIELEKYLDDMLQSAYELGYDAGAEDTSPSFMRIVLSNTVKKDA
jgi:hypothetical protein